MGVIHVFNSRQKMERDRYFGLSNASYEPWDWYDNISNIEGDLSAFYKWNLSEKHYFDFGNFTEDWNLIPGATSEYSLLTKILELKNEGGWRDIRGKFSAESYDKKYLKVLDVLEENGAALIFVPILNYSEIAADVEQQGFFVNAIFSMEDDREAISEIDKNYILPTYCKYLLLIITKKTKDTVYLDLESKAGFSDDYLSYLEDKVKVVNINNLYKHIIKGVGVSVKSSELKKIDLQSIYADGNFDNVAANYKEMQLHELHELVSIDEGDSSTKFYKIGKFLSAFRRFKIRIDCDINNSLDAIQELIDLIEDSEKNGIADLKYLEFQTSLRGFYEQGEKGCQKLFDNYKNKFIITEEKFEYRNNTIKIKPFSSFEYSEISDWSDENFVLVNVDDKKILPEYLEVFFASKVGCLSIQKAYFVNNKKKWRNIGIYLPSIQEQKLIVSSINKLDMLNDQLDSLQNTLLLNPNKARDIKVNLTDWLKRLDRLSLDEKIIELVKNGETEVVEFKETLSLDIKKQTKQKYIEHSSLKTIAGFLNSKGGVLLVGVSDNGLYPGIFEEVEKFHKDKLNKANFDKFLLHFKNLIKRSVGEEFYPYIEYQLVDVNESKVLYVNCGKSEKPCYLDGKDFYVRTNPATDKLEGPKLVDYIQNHFS